MPLGREVGLSGSNIVLGWVKVTLTHIGLSLVWSGISWVKLHCEMLTHLHLYQDWYV